MLLQNATVLLVSICGSVCSLMVVMLAVGWSGLAEAKELSDAQIKALNNGTCPPEGTTSGDPNRAAVSVETISVLHRAAQHGCIDLVRLLLCKKANKMQKTSVGDIALHYAARRRDAAGARIAALLLQDGDAYKQVVEVNMKWNIPLHNAANGTGKGGDETVRLLLGGAGADREQRHQLGAINRAANQTAMYYALERSSFTVLRIMAIEIAGRQFRSTKGIDYFLYQQKPHVVTFMKAEIKKVSKRLCEPLTEAIHAEKKTCMGEKERVINDLKTCKREKLGETNSLQTCSNEKLIVTEALRKLLEQQVEQLEATIKILKLKVVNVSKSKITGILKTLCEPKDS